VGTTGNYISKGVDSTLSIWSLHSDAHDFSASYKTACVHRKVFSSNLAHLALVLFWILGMSFYGFYFLNYIEWINDKENVAPTSQLVWEVVGQGILNSDLGY
jgi:hypothetical protein